MTTDASAVLAQHQFEYFSSKAPKDKFNGCRFYKTNPVDDVTKYCSREKKRFVDGAFTPSRKFLADGIKPSSPDWVGLDNTASTMTNELAKTFNKDIKDGKIGCQRPDVLFAGKAVDVFIDGVNASDVLQGGLGDCWLIAFFANLASQHPETIFDAITPHSYNKWGAYSVGVIIKGERRYVMLDDQFMVTLKAISAKVEAGTTSGTPCFARSYDGVPTKTSASGTIQGELWIMLLEKAAAKMCGGYVSLHFSNNPAIRSVFSTDALFLSFSGAVLNRSIKKAYWDKKLDGLYTTVNNLTCSNCVMTCLAFFADKQEKDAKTGKPNGRYKGIHHAHVYSILGVFTVTVDGKNHQLIRMRNPWGRGEWTGDFRDNDPKWSSVDSSIRTAVFGSGSSAADDGVFCMPLAEFSVIAAAIWLLGPGEFFYDASYEDDNAPVLKSPARSRLIRQSKYSKMGAIDSSQVPPEVSGRVGARTASTDAVEARSVYETHKELEHTRGAANWANLRKTFDAEAYIKKMCKVRIDDAPTRVPNNVEKEGQKALSKTGQKGRSFMIADDEYSDYYGDGDGDYSDYGGDYSDYGGGYSDYGSGYSDGGETTSSSARSTKKAPAPAPAPAKKGTGKTAKAPATSASSRSASTKSASSSSA